MPSQGYDHEAERIGITLPRSLRWLLPLALAVGVLLGMGVATLVKGQGAVVTGRAQAKDGDNLLLGEGRGRPDLRLHGIDAPEIDQTCKRADGSDWPCGADARRELDALVKGKSLACTVVDMEKARDRRPIVRCLDGATNVSHEMVRRGFAWVFDDYAKAFDDYAVLKKLEAEAQAQKIGIWQAETEPAHVFRSKRWERYVAKRSDGCPIIANERSRVYHTPWSRGYAALFERTNVTPAPKGKQWFCDEGLAVAAGFRPAR